MTNSTPQEWLRILLFSALVAAAGIARGIEQSVALDIESPATGTLVICGGGDVPDSVMLHFIELAGGAEARIVFVPTAAEGADLDEIDEDLEFFRRQPLGSLTVFHTRSREKANDPEFARPLADATGVWLGGGSQSLLTDAYLGTTAEELIRWVLNRGGVVGGISAGAAVMSPVMIRGGELEPEVGRGFGLLPGTVIDQHFLKRNRQDRLLRVLQAHPNLVGIGIDEGTALLVRGHRLTVMGDSDVVTCLASGSDGEACVQRLKPGEEADLAVLIRAATLRTQPAAERPMAKDRDAVIEPTVKTAEMPVHKPASSQAVPPQAAANRSVAAWQQMVWDGRAGRYVVASPPMTHRHVGGWANSSGRSTARQSAVSGRIPAMKRIYPPWTSVPVRRSPAVRNRGAETPSSTSALAR
jgi:cyanophycinase